MNMQMNICTTCIVLYIAVWFAINLSQNEFGLKLSRCALGCCILKLILLNFQSICYVFVYLCARRVHWNSALIGVRCTNIETFHSKVRFRPRIVSYPKVKPQHTFTECQNLWKRKKKIQKSLAGNHIWLYFLYFNFEHKTLSTIYIPKVFSFTNRWHFFARLFRLFLLQMHLQK